MSGLAIFPNTPKKEMRSGEGQRKEIYLVACLRKRQICTPVHLQGTDMSCRFK
jgi:hypothetical protein